MRCAGPAEAEARELPEMTQTPHLPNSASQESSVHQSISGKLDVTVSAPFHSKNSLLQQTCAWQ